MHEILLSGFRGVALTSSFSSIFHLCQISKLKTGVHVIPRKRIESKFPVDLSILKTDVNIGFASVYIDFSGWQFPMLSSPAVNIYLISNTESIKPRPNTSWDLAMCDVAWRRLIFPKKSAAQKLCVMVHHRYWLASFWTIEYSEYEL